MYNLIPGYPGPIEVSGCLPGESIAKASDMPVYEYHCDSCQLRFEKVQRFSEDPLTVCPNCGGSVHRVIQRVGVIFKGSGFYVTDNRGKSSTMPPTKREGDGKSESKSGEGEPSAPAVEPPPKSVESQSS